MPLVHTEHDYRFKSQLMRDTEFVLYDMAVDESYWQYDGEGNITSLTRRVSPTQWYIYKGNNVVDCITNILDRGFTYIG